MLLVTVGLVMALMMAFGAGAAFADRGGGGHFACDETGCHASGGFGGPDGGFGNNFTNDFSELEVTISGGSGGPGGGQGGRCEFEYLPGEDETEPEITKDAGSRDCCV
jgi:hypothetical protein